MEFRHPVAVECANIRALVQLVVDEVYGGLWAEPPLPIGDEDWTRSWIAVSGGELFGVMLTHEGWIDDLWVLSSTRGTGVGQNLLSIGEIEIAHRGYRMARLRVVSSNKKTILFYRNRGWQMERKTPHEILPIDMTGMCKPIVPGRLGKVTAE